MNKEYKLEMIKVWDKVAPEFSKIGPKYWDYFGKSLVKLASIKRGAKVLDIGTGRDAVLIPLIKKVGENGTNKLLVLSGKAPEQNNLSDKEYQIELIVDRGKVDASDSVIIYSFSENDITLNLDIKP